MFAREQADVPKTRCELIPPFSELSLTHKRYQPLARQLLLFVTGATESCLKKT